jgi:hypothetical protein
VPQRRHIVQCEKLIGQPRFYEPIHLLDRCAGSPGQELTVEPINPADFTF